MLHFFTKWLRKKNTLQNNNRKKTRKPWAFFTQPVIEILEDRTNPATFNYNGTDTLAIDLNNNNETLLLTSAGGGNYTFKSSDNFTGNNTTGLTGNGTTTLTITNALALTDISITDKSGIAGSSLLFGTSTGAYVDNITIILDNPGLSLVTIGGKTNFSGDASFNVAEVRNINVNAALSTENGNISLNANFGSSHPGDFIGVDISANVTTTGNGSITIKGRGGDSVLGNQYGVAINSGAVVKAGGTGTVSVTGVGGNIGAEEKSVDHNYGVYVSGAGSAITSSGGNVSVTGKGGDSIGDDGSSYGVFVAKGGVISSGGTGIVTVKGVGGVNYGEFNYGVYVSGAGSAITSSGGNVFVAGDADAFETDGNHGVYVDSEGVISSGGTGTVAVTGNAGSQDGDSNYGVYVSGAGSAITSSGGNISVTGKGASGSDEFNYGVKLGGGGIISGGGNGSVTILGIGGDDSEYESIGVLVSGTGSSIISSGGNISVTGIGGGKDDSFQNDGIRLNGGQILSKGALSLNGTQGGNFSLGVVLYGGSLSTANSNTALTITADTLTSLLPRGAINAGTGTVTLQNSTAGKAINLGIEAQSFFGLSNDQLDSITAGTLVIGRDDANASGLITVSQALSLTPNLQLIGPSGIALNKNVTTTGSQTYTGTVTLGADLTLTSNSNISFSNTVAGSGAGGGKSLTLTSAGAISGAGMLTAGQLQVSAKTGIQLNTSVDTFSSITNSTSGDITINQTGGISLPTISSPGNLSISATKGIVVSKAISAGGNILLDADNGGPQTGNFIGVNITADITTTNNGNITIEGRGGSGNFDHQHGVSLSGKTVQAGGTGTVTIKGQGGLGDKGINEGVHLDAALVAGVETYARITSAGGDVTVVGTGGNSAIAEQSIFNSGVSLDVGSIIDAGANGKVQVTGTGGGSDSANFGIYLASDSKLKTAGGPLLVIAKGGGGLYSDGLHMEEGGGLDTSSGNGAITVQAVAGTGADSYPITGISIIKGSNPVAINSGTGNLTLIADQLTTGISNLQLLTTGTLTLQPVSNSFASPVSLSSFNTQFNLNPAPGSGFNSLTGLVIGNSTNTAAVLLDQSIAVGGPVSVFAGGGIAVTQPLSANGNILLDADTGSQVSGNFIGVNITANVTTTNNGNITIEGRGGNESSGNQEGIHISGGADVLPNGSGTVVINGIGGASAGNGNDGVYIADTGTMVSSNGGSVVVSGLGGGTGDSASSSGIEVNGALIQSGGTGPVTVTGTGGGGAGMESELNSGVLVYGKGEIKSQGTLAVTGTAGSGGFSTGIGLGAFFGSGKDSGTLSTSNANLTITTDNLFLGNVSTQEGFITAGTAGTVTLRNKTVGTAINLGGIAAGVSLTQAQLNRITAGTLIAGRADAGVESGAITIGAALTLAPNLQIIGPNGITLKNNVTTTGSQTYTGAITLGGNTLLTAGGDLNFSSKVNGAFSLTTSSVGVTTATGNIGDSAPLTSLIIAKSAGANFSESVTTTTSVVIQDTSASKSVAFQGALITPTLTVNAGIAAYDVALNGTGTSITNSVEFKNTGSVSLGNQAEDIILFQKGLTSTATSKTLLAGSIRTSGNALTVDGVSLTANAGLDTTNNGAISAGAVIDLIGGADLNGFKLNLNSGTTATALTGNVTITGGELVSTSDLSIGTAGTPATLTSSASTVIQSQGTLVVQTGSKIDSGAFPLTLKADTLSILSGAAITASQVTIAPATSGSKIFLGAATGTGLVVNQAAFDAMKTDKVIIGEEGNTGRIEVGFLVVRASLEIFADGPGGKVTLGGVLTSVGRFFSSALKIRGSGNTTVISADIITDSDVIIDDAVQVDAAAVTINTSSGNAKVTITGGTGGIFATKDKSNSLTINAGAGAIDLGSAVGFGDNGGAASLVNNVTLSGGSTTLNASANKVQGDFTLSAGTLSLGATGAINTGGDILITSAGKITLTGNTDLVAGSDIQLGGPIEGNFDLQLAADTGDILVSGTVGATTALKTVSITDAKNTTFSSAIKAERLTQSAGTGETTINGAVTASATTGDAISITTRNIIIFQDLSATTGNIVLDADNDTQQTGDFFGVNIRKNVTTTGGNITILGRGGNDSGGDQDGIRISRGSIQAGDNGTLFGSIILAGIAGEAAGVGSEGVRIADGTISSTGGPISISGAGSSQGNDFGNNMGVRIEGAKITNNGEDGTISLSGIAGGAVGTNFNYGVIIEDSEESSSLVQTKSGSIFITGTRGEGDGSSGIRIIDSSVEATTGGSISLTSDSIDINTTDGTINAGTGTVTLQTLTKGTAINLGTASTATFGLSNDQLNKITAGTLVIGREDAGFESGAITVSKALTITPNLTLISPKGISVNATLEGSGNLTLDADNGVQQTGNFTGVNITQNVTTTGNGNIKIDGRGGNDLGGSQRGVAISGGAKVQSGGTGTVVVTGFGGPSEGDFNIGVSVEDSESFITSSGGNVTVTGTGGGSGTSGDGYGVSVEFGGGISAGKNGAVSVTGTGRTGSGSWNIGVFVNGKGSSIISSGGDVTVTGTGGGGVVNQVNSGVWVGNKGLILAGGIGAVTVLGTGGADSWYDSAGVVVQSSSTITSSGGNVTVTGAGGASGFGDVQNDGIEISGTISSLGALTLTGMAPYGSLGLNLKFGTLSTATNNTAMTINTDTININTTNGTITAGTGTVTLQTLTKGLAIDLGTASTTSFGLSNDQLNKITAGTLVVGSNEGVIILEAAANIVSAPLTLNTNLVLNGPYGIQLASNVTTTGSQTYTGAITLGNDISLATTNSNIAFSSIVDGAKNLTLAAGTGDIGFNGAVGLTTALNDILIQSAGNVTLSSTVAAKSLTQSAGTGVTTIKGGFTASATTGDAISITTRNIEITADLSAAGNIVLDADNDAQQTGNFVGVIISGVGVDVTTTGGNITITGRGGNDIGGIQHGISIDARAKVQAGGNGTVSVTGFGGASSGNFNCGVTVRSTASTITSSGGNVTVSGTGGGTGGSGFNYGVYVDTAGTISAGSTGTVTVEGFGGGSSGNLNSGVVVSVAGSITSSGGDVSVRGTGGGSGPDSTQNDGIGINPLGTIRSSGLGTLSLGGTAGVNSGLGLNLEGNLFSNDSNISINANTININTNGVINAGKGRVAFTPFEIDMDLGTASTTSFGLSNEQLNRITADSLFVGREQIGAITVSAPLNLLNISNMEIKSGTGITLAAGVTTPGTQTYSGAVTLGNDISLATTNSNIAFSSIVDGAKNLTLAAGTGNITFTGAVGSTTALGDILIQSAANVTLSSTVAANSLTQSAGTGATTIKGAFTASATTGDAISITTRNIAITADISAASNIVLDADTGVQQAGDFIGVKISGAGVDVTTTGGNIFLAGRGGNGFLGTQYGVQLNSGSKVQAGGTGTVSVTGTGGETTFLGLNYGVYVTGSGSSITSSGGNVSVTGTGGGPSDHDNYGVYVANGGGISAGGTGNVSVTGFGGAGSSGVNFGILVEGSKSAITSPGGNVSVTGTGGAGAGGFNYGVFVSAGGISAGNTGNVTVTGTGGGTGGSTFNNDGIIIDFTGVISSLGAVSLTGKAGANSGVGLNLSNGTLSTSTTNTPLTITTDSININTTNGTITAGTGTVTLQNRTAGIAINLGTASTTSFGLSNDQLNKITAGTLVVGREDAGFESGAITVSSALTIGPNLTLVSPKGIAVNATLACSGNLSLDADNGTQQIGNFRGVSIAQNVATTGNGNITITGRGGDDAGEGQFGVLVNSGAKVQAGGTGAVSVTGTGGASSGLLNQGVIISDSGSAITSSGGDVTVTGKGGGSGEDTRLNYGVYLTKRGLISAGGAGKVTVTGTGASSGIANAGVTIDESTITSFGGDVSVSGTGGEGSGSFNYGVFVAGGEDDSVISAGGTGKVFVTGTGGTNSPEDNYGVYVFGSKSAITSSGGDVTVTGKGGGSGQSSINNFGMRIGSGTISCLGALSLIGTGGVNAGPGLFLEFGTISTATNNTALTITTDTIDINTTKGIITAGTGTVKLQNRTAGTAIDLGTASATSFGLSDAQLERITAGTLIIGREDTGFESGAITVSADLTLSPSLKLNGPNGVSLNGNVNSKGLTLNDNHTLNLQLAGASPGTGYKQFVTTGAVVLTNSNLNLTIPSTFVPANGTEFILIANDGADPIQGTFQNFANNQLVTINGINYRFSYFGGDGNDVTLGRPTAQPVVVGAFSSSGGMVQLTLAGDSTPTTFIPFPGFFGEIRVSSEGDFSNDGVFDFVAAAGPSGGPRVTIMDGVTGGVFSNFFAYNIAFTGGVFTSTGDVTGDGLPDLVTGAGVGGGPHVIVWDGATLSNPNPTIVTSFFAYDEAFRGGVTVAAGDLDGDRFAEIITGAGPGGAPQVNVYASRTFELLNSFLAYAPQFSGGVFVAVGELNGDTQGEIITGAGSGGGSQVNVFDSQSLQILNSFFAYGDGFTGGVRVGALDYNGDAIDDIVTGAGPGGGPHVKVLELDQTLLDQFFAGDADFPEGVFVS